MQIVENLSQWAETYEETWLAHYEATGETNFKIYERPRNQEAPGVPGIDLTQSRLLLISSAGGYLKASQSPFDAANALGDYTIRTFPITTPFSDLAFAHDHYDHTAVDDDPQVLLPLAHLDDLVAEGAIGALVPQVISFHGYQPDVRRTVHELIPTILDIVDKKKVDAVLLVPA